MLSKLLGAIVLVSGVVWLIKPRALKNRLSRKMNRKLRFIIYGFAITFGLLIIGSVITAPGLVSKVVGIIAMVITIKLIMVVTSKGSEKLSDWMAKKPVAFFRLWAAFTVLFAVMLILS